MYILFYKVYIAISYKFSKKKKKKKKKKDVIIKNMYIYTCAHLAINEVMPLKFIVSECYTLSELKVVQHVIIKCLLTQIS